MNISRPLVSFIIPIYKVEKYLKQCIDSICGQAYHNIEIILVDDGSTDSCPDICDEYSANDNRIKVIHKQNGGLVSARKAGLDVSCGKYVACVDGDDWIETNALGRLINIGTDADIICFAIYEEFGNNQREIKKNTVAEGLYNNNSKLNKLFKKMLMNGNFFESGILPYQCGKFIKRELLLQCQKNVSDDISYAEDVACIYPCLLMAKSIYVTNMPIYHYRILQDSIVKKEVEPNKLHILFEILVKPFSKHYLAKELNNQLQYYMWQSLLLKGYSYIDSSMPLFPFTKVKAGMRVAVYGAGLFGRVIKNYCDSSVDLSVVGWFDKKYDIYTQQGLLVTSSDEVINITFDIMVIAILNVDLSKLIKENYINQGISEKKIDLVNTDILDNSVLPHFCQDLYTI